MEQQPLIDDPPKEDRSDLTKYDANGLRLYEHPIDSPYHGLTLAEQLFLSKLRRPRGRTPKAIKKRLRKATDETYASLLVACTNALIVASEDGVETRLDRIKVRLELIFNYRNHFNKDFPRPAILGYKDWSTIVEFKVDSLVNYLHKIGKSQYTARELRTQLWLLRKEIDKVYFNNHYFIDLSVAEYYNDLLTDPEQKVERKLKGRRTYRKKEKKDV